MGVNIPVRALAAVVAAVVVALLAQPAMAQAGGAAAGSPSSELWALLRQIQRKISEITSWIWSQVNDAVDAIRSNLSPVIDTYHAVNSIARWVESMANSLPAEFSSILRGTVDRLRNVAEPRPGTFASAVQKLIEEKPDSELARAIRAREEMSAASEVNVAKARISQKVAEGVARSFAEDTSAEINVQVASASARELAARAQHTPSTRAAVQLLIEGFAAFMDQQAHQNSDISSRLTSLVQQQALLSQQLTTIAEQSSTLVQLIADQQKREAEAAAATMSRAMDNGLSGLHALTQALQASTDSSGQRRLYETLRNVHR